jgi:hypothetical protein
MILDNPIYWYNNPLWTTAATIAQLVGVSIAAWAALESRKSARAAKQSVELTAQAMKYRDRAYIALEWSGINGLKSPDDVLTIHLKFRNIGSTPASLVRQYNYFNINEDTISLSDNELTARLSSTSILGDVAPSQDFEINMLCDQSGQFIALTPQSFQDLQAGKWTLHVFGRITYRDVFGIDHETRWSRVYDHKNKSFPNTPHFNSIT